MTQSELLSQDEIDALLMGDSDPKDYQNDLDTKSKMHPYDPAKQHRVINERLHALDIINEHFARSFRISMLQLLRRNTDITVSSVKYQSYSDFSRQMPVPSNLNLIAMRPLRGTALVAFPPKLVYMVVDNLFGGDGRFIMKAEGREFTTTENRIIKRLIDHTIDCYKSAWKKVVPLEIEYIRSEMQARFANVTSAPNEIVVNTTFHLEVGSFVTDFNIALPFLMIEPIRSKLSSPPSDIQPEEEKLWNHRMASEVKQSEILISADFVSIDSTISEVMKLKEGDVLDLTLPDSIIAKVDGIPVLECDYGSKDGVRALMVKSVLNHMSDKNAEAPVFKKR